MKEQENRTRLRRAKREKKQKRQWVIKGIAGAVLLYLILLIIFSLYSGMSTIIAMNGTVQEEILADGYIFREQTVLKAPVGGYLETVVRDGDRVKEGQIIGYIYTGEYQPETTQKIQEISQQIARMESDLTSSTYTGSVVMAEQKIGIAARDLSDLRTRRDISILSKHKDTLNLLIEKKNATSDGESTDPAALLMSLKEELYALESQGGGKTALVAETPGVFCARVDGLEEKLNLAEATNVTVSSLKQLDAEETKRSKEVLPNEPVCKIVNNYGWSFATCIPQKDAEQLQVGGKIRLRFFELSDTTIYGTVQSISPEENGKVAVSVYTNRYVEGIYGVSRASAEVITVSVEGIKIPADSLHMQENQTGVYVLRLGVVRFVPVHVNYRNDHWAIISPVLDTGAEYKLQIYDEIVVKAKNLEDGKVVR